MGFNTGIFQNGVHFKKKTPMIGLKLGPFLI